MIDTLQVSRRLRDAGADERVADAVAAVVAEAALGSREDLATKSDLGLLRANFALLRSEVNVFRTEMEKAIIASQTRMLLAIGAMLAATVGCFSRGCATSPQARFRPPPARVTSLPC